MGKHSFKEWVFATRPWSFPASAMPVLVTLFYLNWMECEVNWLIGIWTIINIVLFHAAGNTWSDYHDFISGVDRDDTVGGTSITSGAFTPEEIRSLSMMLLSVAVIFGLILVRLTGMTTLWLGVAGALLTVLYPWLKYHALGDVDIFLTYSLLPVLGTSFVASGDVCLQTLWLTVPVGLITVGILHVNNMRDTEHDNRAGIKTFAMKIGRKVSVWLYCIELILPFVWIALGIALGVFPFWALLVVFALKPAIDNSRKAVRYLSEGREILHGVDEFTAKMQLIFSLLLSVSLFIATIF